MTVTVSLPVFVMYAKGVALAIPAPGPAANETTRAKTTAPRRRRKARSGTADDHCSDGAGLSRNGRRGRLARNHERELAADGGHGQPLEMARGRRRHDLLELLGQLAGEDQRHVPEHLA